MFTYIYNAVHYCTDFGTNTLVRVSCVRKEMVSLFLATVPKEKENVWKFTWTQSEFWCLYPGNATENILAKKTWT